MAIPVGVLITAAEAVRNPVVQDTAKTIFGWLRNRKDSEAAGLVGKDDVSPLLRELPTRAELALAFSQIHVRIAASERRCIRVLSICIAFVDLSSCSSMRLGRATGRWLI